MEHNDLPTEVLQGEMESLMEALRKRVSITLTQGHEFFTLSIPLGSCWRTESSARHAAEMLWDNLLEPALRIHMTHVMAELERRRAPSSVPELPG
jgi:hypothetical protein